ncbi:hypothetical protein CK203_046862 [Vitis vinifera]|uniref:Uncharacterized protein n=2 Tax=Vitis vinifera TaxID=29760 RepID=A0A438HY75_VITVI|nr:hypothetical protein CK203_046862 [Vitis vinifera]
MNGWMDRMLDYQERLKVDIQLDSYDQTMGEFESRVAIDSRKLQSPTSKSGSKNKEKEMNLTPIHEDGELDEMGGVGSGNFPTIDTLDEDDDDIGEEHLS